MKQWITAAVMASAVCSITATAHASSWGDNLRQQASQLSQGSSEKSGTESALGGLLGGSGTSSSLLSSLGVPASGTASNAAGVLSYCVQNNYINASKDKAEQVKDQLLGTLGLQQKEAPKDEGYLSGLAGKITGQDGKSFSMDQLKGDLKEKACDFVLNNAKSLL